jgi:hypothetical protein
LDRRTLPPSGGEQRDRADEEHLQELNERGNASRKAKKANTV